jgi:hypothetical protein
MIDLERTLLQDFREAFGHGRRDGIQRGLGMASDIAYQCADEAERLGKSSDGYRRAVFDIAYRLLEKMKENDQ